MFNELKNILIKYDCNNDFKKGLFFEDSFDSYGKSFQSIQFILANLGTILEEYTNENIFIVSIKVLLNPAILAVEVKDGFVNVVAWALEGLIKQHTAKKATIKIKKAIQENEFKIKIV